MKLKETTKIYLITNCYGDPNKVYIGKTKNNRKNNHIKTFGNNIDYDYIDEINSLKHNDWEPLETYWIEQFRQWGFEIMNIRKKGGSGPDFHSDETKLKISNLAKGKNTWRAGKLSPNSGGKGKSKLGSGNKNWTEDHLILFRLAAKNKNKSFYNDIKWIKAQQKCILQYDLNNNFIKEWDSIKNAGEKLNINRTSISQCLSLNNRQKSAGGFIWRYK
jgi:group I intron endonuclease